MTTLQTIIEGIDTEYPVAGQDNDSQGFRDNFNYIKDALTTANTEITTLDTTTVKKGSVQNDLLGCTLENGLYNNLSGVTYTNSGDLPTIEISNGTLQIFSIASNQTYFFAGWPEDSYAQVRLHFINTGNSPIEVTLSSESGIVIYPKNYSTPINVEPSGNTKFSAFDAWSYDGGATIYVQPLDNGTVSGSIDYLNNVGDVQIVDAHHGDTLKYNSSSSKWTNNVDLVEYNVTMTNASTFQITPDGKNNILSQFVFDFGKKYRFYVDDPSNTTHVLKFGALSGGTLSQISESNNIHRYGTPGSNISNNRSYVEIFITNDFSETVLYLYVNTDYVSSAIPIGHRTYTGFEILPDPSTVINVNKSTTCFNAPASPQTSQTYIQLKNGYEGQFKTLVMIGHASNNDMHIYPLSPGWTNGSGIIKFTAVGQSCLLQFINNHWYCVGNNGAIFT